MGGHEESEGEGGERRQRITQPRKVLIAGAGKESTAIAAALGGWLVLPRADIEAVRVVAHTGLGRRVRVALVVGSAWPDVVTVCREVKLMASWWDIVLVLAGPLGEADRAYLHRIGVVCMVPAQSSPVVVVAACEAAIRRYAMVITEDADGKRTDGCRVSQKSQKGKGGAKGGVEPAVRGEPEAGA